MCLPIFQYFFSIIFVYFSADYIFLHIQPIYVRHHLSLKKHILERAYKQNNCQKQFPEGAYMEAATIPVEVHRDKITSVS